MNSNLVKILLLFIIVCGVQYAVARTIHTRVKRVSDSHLADLLTKLALKNYGVVVTVPIGAGRIDTKAIGRKRRSQSRFLDVLFNQSEEEVGDGGAAGEEEDGTDTLMLPQYYMNLQ